MAVISGGHFSGLHFSCGALSQAVGASAVLGCVRWQVLGWWELQRFRTLLGGKSEAWWSGVRDQGGPTLTPSLTLMTHILLTLSPACGCSAGACCVG